MAYEIPGFKFSAIAGADLSAAQFTFVKLSADNTVTQCSATTDTPIGVLQNKPGSAAAADVMVMGITKLVAGGSLGYGSRVGTDASGKGTSVAAGTGGTVAFPMGYVVEGNTAANGLVTALIGIPTTHSF